MLKPRLRPRRGYVIASITHNCSTSSTFRARSNFRPNPSRRPSPTSAAPFHSQAIFLYPRQRRQPIEARFDPGDPGYVGREDLPRAGLEDTVPPPENAVGTPSSLEPEQMKTPIQELGSSARSGEFEEAIPSESLGGPLHAPTPSVESEEVSSSEELETPQGGESKHASIAAPGQKGNVPTPRPGIISLSSHYDLQPFRGHIEITSHGISKKLSYVRLREACRCPKCLDSLTLQKNITLGQVLNQVEKSGFINTLPGDLLHLSPVTSSTPPSITIHWGNHEGAHVSTYTQKELQDLCEDRSLPSSQQFSHTWGDAESLMSKAQANTGGSTFGIYYEELVNAEGHLDRNVLGVILKQLVKYGFVLLKEVPTTMTSNEECMLRTVANWIGPIRNTFYGETWDVINKKDDSRNVAYTDKDLGLHMDLLYFENPPRYQLLHCLRNKVHGGQSYFVDGFYIRQDMMRESRQRYLALFGTRIPYMYNNDGHKLVAHRPVFERGPYSSDLTTIAWSPPFQGSTGSIMEYPHQFYNRPMADWDHDFLTGIQEWEERINDPARQFEFTMEEGDLVLFDNRRVLHARRGFRELTEEERKERGVKVAEGEPSRWLKGCYLDGDAVWDSVLRSGMEDEQRREMGEMLETNRAVWEESRRVRLEEMRSMERQWMKRAKDDGETKVFENPWEKDTSRKNIGLSGSGPKVSRSRSSRQWQSDEDDLDDMMMGDFSGRW